MAKAPPKKRHKLSGVPTAYDETQKILHNKDIGKIEAGIEGLEAERRARDEEAILELLNDHNQGKNPIVKMATLQEETFQQALGSLLAIRNTEAFETIMLLYEHLESLNSNYKADKITGTELLRLSGTKGINQEKRHTKLNLLVKQSAIKIKVLDPEQSLKNFKNKGQEGGLTYKIFDLLKISKVTYSKRNPDLIVKLEGVEFLPSYMEHFHLISKRYVPLQTIRKIPEEKAQGKTRHFIYKLCFKFAGMQKNEAVLSLDECMNIGKFFNKSERNLKRKWKPIEKALLKARELNLFDFEWIFKPLPEHEKGNYSTNLFGEIQDPAYNEDGTLLEDYYKHIASVSVHRVYNLNAPSLSLPVDLEKVPPKREKRGIKAQF